MKSSDNLSICFKKLEGTRVVQCWQMHNKSATSVNQKVLPSPYVHLVFPLKGHISISEISKEVSKPFFAPILSCYKEIKIEAGATIFGVHIQPFYCSALFGQSPSELIRNAHMVEDILRPHQISSLKDAILLAENFDQRVKSVLVFFNRLIDLQDTCKRNTTKGFISLLRNDPVISMRQAAKELGYSTRWMQKIHKELIGISPGEMRRIIRFNRFINKLYFRNENLTQLALECGYFDQAHAIHEFKRLGGITPGFLAKTQPSIPRILNYDYSR